MIKTLKIWTKQWLGSLVVCLFILPVMLIGMVSIQTLHERVTDWIARASPSLGDALLIQATQRQLPVVMANIDVFQDMMDRQVQFELNALSQEKKDIDRLFHGYFDRILMVGMGMFVLAFFFSMVLSRTLLKAQMMARAQQTNSRGLSDDSDEENGFTDVTDELLQVQDQKNVACTLNHGEARKKMEAHIQHQALHDQLTDLPNRTLLEDRLQQAIAEAKHTQSIVAILFLDLDQFKVINDRLGHDFGDRLLKIIAKRLCSNVRKSDVAARLSGDEFVLIFKHLKTRESILPIVSKILNEVMEPFQLEHLNLTITCSIGISFYPQDGQTPLTLLKHADSAMYRSKALGRNTFQFYRESMSEQSMIHRQMESELSQAIEGDELCILYQPSMNVQVDKVLGAEALVCWIHPERGMILPEEFLSLAEESGLIIPIGDWTLMTACQQCADWADELYVSVSISDKQFNYGDIVESVRKALKLSGLRPSRLELGLKESALANHAQSTDRKIKALKALGVTLAIDGFGTGCSTINVIRQFLIDKIKVDPSLVGEIGAAESGFELMQAIITLAKSLNLSVLAEGVEKQTQLDFLKTCHCEQVQGNLLSQAMSGTEFQTWVKDFNQGDQTPP